MAYKTPGVYIEEIAKFPPSVAEVETAIPAFIGYTEKAVDPEFNNLTNKPVKIRSLVDYELLFGGAWSPANYTVTLDTNFMVTGVAIKKFYLYDSLRAFFDNGGGKCYIVSVGSYSDDIEYLDNSDPSNPIGLKAGLDALAKYDEPTLILFPDAVGSASNGTGALTVSQLGTLQADVLTQCNKLQDRFGIFDILGGFAPGDTPITNFRNNIGTENLKYGAAYYPWLKTTYNHEFMLRNVLAAPATPITDVALPANAILDPFLNNYETMHDQTDMVISKVTGLDITDFNSLTDYYNNLVAVLNSIPTTQPAAVTTAFREIQTFLRNVVLSFDAIENDPDTGTDISTQIASFLTDTELHDEMINYISFEKNDTVISELSDLADEPEVNTTYAAYTTNNDWLIGTATFADVDAIPVLPTGTLNLVPLANTKAKALAAISYINNNIDLPKLLGALEKLFDIALQGENIAEDQLIANYPFFSGVFKAIQEEMSLLPPSGYIAGVYANVDSTRGVWKSPANVSLKNVIAPSVKVSDADQEGLNVDTSGKSINAIRAFAGKGILVWGGRTLAGDDNEWRYINVRRFFNMVEESVKKATNQFVFDSNDANTWTKVRGMIENFLIIQWRQGALAGAKPEDAFFVSVGLGQTMTALDILEGRMNVEIGMAAVRPAEFIILKFSHKMLS
jgi:phage tail sheath protein FI